VLDMLQAMNTGHDGSMATVHANSPDDAIARLITMLGMTGTALGEETMASMIARAVHVVVQIARHADGRRRIVGIAEVLGQRGTDVPLHPVFAFERTGVDGNGLVLGSHVQLASSMLTDHFRAAGVLTPPLRWIHGGGADGGVAAAAGEIG
jgi:pilus assembly protein CpaF